MSHSKLLLHGSALRPRRSAVKAAAKEHKASVRRLFTGLKAAAVAVFAGVIAAVVTLPAAAAAPAVFALLVGFGTLAAPVQAYALTVPRIGNYVPGMQGIGPGSTGTLNVPVNKRYHSMRILTTNAAAALTDPTTIVSNVQLEVNGVTIRQGAPATFINIAKTFGYTPGAGEIPIFFTEFWRNESPRAAEATSWDMFGQNTFVVKLTFLSPGGGVGIQSILADFDLKRNVRRDSSNNWVPFLEIIKQYDISYNANSGQNDVTVIPTNYPLQRIFTAISANAISKIEVYADDNFKQWEFTKTENQYVLGANQISPTFFEYPLVFDYDFRIDSSLSTSYLDLRVFTTGAATLTHTVHARVPAYR